MTGSFRKELMPQINGKRQPFVLSPA